MFSLTKTGTCLRPSCTPTVWPTISGKIVESRAHVRTTFLSLLALSLAIFSCRLGSMYGPFLSERDILFLLPAPDDQLVGGLLPLARAQAQRRLAPGGLRVPAGPRLALASAVGVIGRVHGRAAHGRAHAQPPRPAGLPARLVLGPEVAHLAKGP